MNSQAASKPARRGSDRAWLNGYLVVDLAILTGAVVLVLIPTTRYWLPRVLDPHQGNVYVALSAVAATLLGFMIAAITILLTIGGRRLTKTYVESDLYPQTLNLFHVTAIYLALTTIAAIVGLFIDANRTTRKIDHGTLLTSVEFGHRDLGIWLAVALALIAAWRFLFSLSILKGVSDLVVRDRQPERPSQVTETSEPPSDEELTRPL